MALKAIVNKEEFDSLGVDIQTHYSPDSENIDVFCLGVTPVNGIELAGVTGLKTALQKERSSVTTLKAALSSFDGINAEEAHTAIIELEALKKDGGTNQTRDEVRAELDTVYDTKFKADRETLTKKFTSDIEVKDIRIGTLSRQLEKTLTENASVSAIVDAGGVPELLLPVISQRTKVVTLENGNLAIRIIGDDGHERLSPVAGNSDPMTISEFVGELKDDSKFGRAFKPSGATGSGASTSGEVSSNSGEIILSREAAKNPRNYQAAKEQAKEQGKTFGVVPLRSG